MTGRKQTILPLLDVMPPRLEKLNLEPGPAGGADGEQTGSDDHRLDPSCVREGNRGRKETASEYHPLVATEELDHRSRSARRRKKE